MADATYSIAVETSGAQRNVENLTNKVKGLTDKFAGLKSAVAGIAFGQMIGSAIKYADAIQDIANTTGIATENILGLNKAVATNGGDAETAQKGVLKLVQTIADAADGSKSAQNAFEDVGISLRDLSVLSEQDILKRTIDGLSKIDDASKRLKLTNELLGKGFRTVDLKGLNDDYAQAVIKSRQYATSVQSAAKLQDNLTMAVGNFKMSLLQSLKPLIDFLNELSPEQIQRFTDALVKIGGAAGGLYAVGKGLQFLSVALASIAGYFVIFKGGWGMMVAGAASVGLAFASLSKTVSIAFNYISRFFRGTPQFAATNGLVSNLITLFTKLAERMAYALAAVGGFWGALKLMTMGFVRMIPFIGAVATALWAVYEAVKMAFNIDLVDEFTDAVKKSYRKVRELVGLSNEATKLPDTGAGAGRGKYTKEQIKDLNKLSAEQMAQWEQEQTIKRQVDDAYKKQKLEIEKVSKAYKEQNNEIVRILALDASYIGKNEDIVEVLKAQDDVYKRSRDSIKQLQDQKAGLSNEDAKLIPIIDAQIAAIEKQAKVDANRIAVSIQGLQSVRLLEQDRINNIERINELLQFQANAAQVTSGIYSETQKKIRDVQFGAEQRGRSPVQQQIAEINKTIDEFYAENAGKIMAAFETEDGFRNMDEMNRQLDLLNKKTEILRQAQLKDLEVSRSFSAGWTEAFNNYVDSATNAANRARNIFSAFTNFTDSLIDNFVDGTKISFEDMANSFIKEILKMELKAAAANLWGAMSAGAAGGGGLFGGAIIPGFLASGGPAQPNKPYVVGEKGPELFVPNSAGTVIPNGAGQGQMTNNNYTYNISAVDAQSVARLFANNRQLMLGTIEQARKELPVRGRR